MVSLATSTFFQLLSSWAGNYVPVENVLWVASELVSIAFCVACFWV